MRSPPRGSRTRALVRGLLVALALACAGAPIARAQDDELLEALKRVESVRIEGNHEISSGTIKKVLRTGGTTFLGLRSPPLFRPDFLRSDVRAIQTLYLRRGFLDAQVGAAADSGSRPGRVVVTYHIVEGPQVLVRSIAIDSSAVFNDEERREALELEPGEPYDPVQVALDRGALGVLYGDRGHFPVIETTVERDSQWVDIRYVVRDGPPYVLRDVRVSGVQRVDTSAVRREVLLAPGELYRRNRVLESSERLTGTGLFSTVEIEPARLDSAGGSVDLDVRVRERKPRWVEGGVGTGTVDKVRFLGAWGNRNLGGEGNALTVSGDLGVRYFSGPQVRLRYKGEVTYIEPWLFQTRTRGSVATSFERGAEQFSDFSYVQETARLSFGAARDFYGSRSRVSLVFDNTWSRVVRVIEPDTLDPSAILIAPYLPSVTLAYDQDRRDDPLNPRRGMLNYASVQVAGLRQNTGAFWKVEGQTSGHVPLRTRTSLALRLRAGVLKPVGSGPGGPLETLERVPLNERYRVGGTTTIRGYHDNGIDADSTGGALLGLVNAELRTHLIGPLGGHVFVDGGNVWRDPSEFTVDSIFRPSGVNGTTARNDVRWSYGVGVSVFTPVGPVRFDYGRRFYAEESDLLKGRRLEMDLYHFAIGFTY